LGKQAVVEPAAAAKASAAGIEGDARAEERVDFQRGDFCKRRNGFENAEGSGRELDRRIRHGMKREMIACDFRIDEATAWQTGRNF